jgi:microcystin-dependent protein
MSEAMTGEIRLFSSDAIPQNWMPCNGQLLQIRDNPALFSLLGTSYGGDSNTTYALPDLRARIPIHESDRRRIGDRVRTASGSERVPTEPQPFLAFSFCICTHGNFPRRP